MKRMMIVDDEQIVRKGIKETISWEDYDIEIVGEAANGEEGFRKILELDPDIVLSDIKMPVMDGVDLAKKIDSLHKDIAIVILSGYQDFSFAKGVFEHGAIEYLLKPINNQELVASVLRALDKKQTLKSMKQKAETLTRELPALQKQFLYDLGQGKIHDEVELASKISEYQIDLSKTGFVIYSRIDHRETYVESNQMEKRAQNLFQAIHSQLKPFLPLAQLFESEMYFVVDTNKELLDTLLHRALGIYEKLYNDSVSIGVSAYFSSWSQLDQGFISARMNAEEKLFPSLNSIHFENDFQEKLKPIVQDAMDYIASHFHQNLTVKTVSEALYVSESYLLHTFKDNTGKTFNETLTSYRILMAKKWLLDKNVKIYEIAERVGYFDVKYFSQIFKKKVGLTPSEYRNQKAAASL